MSRILVSSLLVVLAAACNTDDGGRKGGNIAEDGLPVWLDQPCQDQPDGTICGVGESNLAATDTQLAKTEAENLAKVQVADQLQTRVTARFQKYQEAVSKLGQKRKAGVDTMKNAIDNLTNQQVVGLRYTDYFYYPDRINPEKVWVRATLTQDDNEVSQAMVDAMASIAVEELGVTHEEAMAELEKARQQDLAERGLR